jgi:hypothetical protein
VRAPKKGIIEGTYKKGTIPGIRNFYKIKLIHNKVRFKSAGGS